MDMSERLAQDRGSVKRAGAGMIRIAAMGLALLAGAAEAGVVLKPGESVTVTISDSGDWSVSAPVARGLDNETGQIAALLQSQTGNRETYQAVQSPNPIQVQPGVIRFTFARQGRIALLIAENGRERPLVYRAQVPAPGGALHATSICPAPAGKYAVETWGDPLDRIELDGFALPESAPPLWLGCK